MAADLGLESPREKAFQLALKYSAILDEMFTQNTIRAEIPWHDPRFREMFSARIRVFINRQNEMELTCTKWAGIMDLAAAAGRATK